MIKQKPSPKTAYLLRLTNENYDFLCRVVGEESIALYINNLIAQHRRTHPLQRTLGPTDIGTCASPNPLSNM